MAPQTVLVDTNIFLEFLREQERSEACLQLMRKIERGEIEAYVTSFTLHGIEISLERVHEIEGLEKFLDWVSQTTALTVYHTSPEEELQVAALTKTTGLDFDDALQYYVTKTLGAVLVSFDRDFDHTDIERIEPSDMA